jgi:imidazole glycerol-phosphate synthase subunit HisH
MQDAFILHSYGFYPEDSSKITGTCEDGHEFAASIEFENIMATQFHPEKSRLLGLKVLKNFTEAVVAC